MHMKNFKWIISFFIFASIVIGMKSPITKLPILERTDLSPIIMVPGSSAGENRFDYLISNLPPENDYFKHSLLKIKIDQEGRLQIRGNISIGDDEPIIVIAFKNNRDGYKNINQQAKLLGHAIIILKRKYNFNNFRALGHSNGGLIWTLAIERYINTSKIHLDCLMTIATPYNLENESYKRSQMLDELIDNRNRIPHNTTVYSIAGAQSYDTDGKVESDSVYSGKYIFQPRVKYFTEITVTGADTGHYNLPQNRQVIGIVSNYLCDNLARTNTFE
ncbi:alpha/beta hydrolase [Companilactobacillus crustorum]|uniref:alpha/beta hydrolase n=1 Tax=Companilactobacillus crustorum TaxID=392416 RepID=UPI00096A9F66|nr:alpha/beta hydrolase [Companilactobacillus crustorum]